MKGLEKSALTVSAVAFFLSDLIKDHLGSVLIKGEISNLQLRKHSAYVRFSLKDSSAKIDCLTHESSNAAKLIQHLQDGDEVIVFATPSFYKKSGQISFFTDEMMKLGDGIFRSALERLKQTLYEEGLFDPLHKKPLPSIPSKIGVVTSADGAALQDILRVANDRFPIVNIMIFPSLVQGENAANDLVKSLTLALSHDLDAIIIGRGGGSGEDLDAFNNEKLVRLVASAQIPIISAVGHEIDTTLIDYVSDFSAPTPTGAAMKLLPDKRELLKDLDNAREDIGILLKDHLRTESQEIKFLQQIFYSTYEKYITTEQQLLTQQLVQLSENNPAKILSKGFAWIGEQQLETGQEIKIFTKNQHITATITETKDISHG